MNETLLDYARESGCAVPPFLQDTPGNLGGFLLDLRANQLLKLAFLFSFCFSSKIQIIILHFCDPYPNIIVLQVKEVAYD